MAQSESTTEVPVQGELIHCPICLQEFDPQRMGLSTDDRNRLLLGYRLHTLRDAKGWTLGDVAQRMGVATSVVFGWENAVRDVPLRRALQFAKLYGVDMNTLTAEMVAP